VKEFDEHESFEEAEHRIYWENLNDAERILDHESHSRAVNRAGQMITESSPAVQTGDLDEM